MTELEVVIREANKGELRVLAGVLQRANAQPAVVVTLQEGKRRRRYVVYREDEHLFDALIGNLSLEQVEQHFGSRLVWFGGQWLRGAPSCSGRLNGSGRR